VETGFKLVAQADNAAGAARQIDLTCVDRLMNAGEQVTPEVCDAFLRVTGLPPSVMQPAFGMAEVCTCMTYNNDFTSGEAACVAVFKSSLDAPVLALAPPGTPPEQCARLVDPAPPLPTVPYQPVLTWRMCTCAGALALWTSARPRPAWRFASPPPPAPSSPRSRVPPQGLQPCSRAAALC
jgi:hypothetical protein